MASGRCPTTLSMRRIRPRTTSRPRGRAGELLSGGRGVSVTLECLYTTVDSLSSRRRGAGALCTNALVFLRVLYFIQVPILPGIRRRRLAGAERGSRVSQFVLNSRGNRMRATEHAPRDRC